MEEDWEEKVKAACAAVIESWGKTEKLRDAARQLWQAATAYSAKGRPAALEALGDAAWWAAAGVFDRAEAELRVVSYGAALEPAIASWCEAAAAALARQIERHRSSLEQERIEARRASVVSAQPDPSDPWGIVALFQSDSSDPAPDQSDQSGPPDPWGLIAFFRSYGSDPMPDRSDRDTGASEAGPTVPKTKA